MEKMEDVTFDQLITVDKPEIFLESAQPFMKLMMQYQCAMLEIQTKFQVLNAELSLDSDQNPIETISCRLKKPISIIEKLKRKNFEVTVENIEKHLQDVAGVRVICSFPRDIYILADKICSQDDIRLIAKKDYIQNPKKNGYRSLHLILEVPVFFSNETKPMKVEVQLRTIAMDLWASIEHKIKYKKEIKRDSRKMERELCLCAEQLHRVDLRMQEIGQEIEKENENVVEDKSGCPFAPGISTIAEMNLEEE